MLSDAEITSMRQSAAMAPLGIDDVRRLLDHAHETAAERAQIVELLHSMPKPFADVRQALNELQRLVGG